MGAVVVAVVVVTVRPTLVNYTAGVYIETHTQSKIRSVGWPELLDCKGDEEERKGKEKKIENCGARVCVYVCLFRQIHVIMYGRGGDDGCAHQVGQKSSLFYAHIYIYMCVYVNRCTRSSVPLFWL